MSDHEHQSKPAGGLSAVDRSVGQPTRDEVRAARSVAEHMAALGGPDLRHMSDVELVAHMKQMAKAIGDALSKVGISADEASRSFQRLAEAMNKAPNASNEGPALATVPLD